MDCELQELLDLGPVFLDINHGWLNLLPLNNFCHWKMPVWDGTILDPRYFSVQPRTTEFASKGYKHQLHGTHFS
jgi:hypothetical protein